MNLNRKTLVSTAFGLPLLDLPAELQTLIPEVLSSLFFSHHSVFWCKAVIQSLKSKDDVLSFLHDFQDVLPPSKFIEVNFTNYDKVEREKRAERLSRIVKWVEAFGELSNDELIAFSKVFNLEIEEVTKRNIAKKHNLPNSPQIIYNLLSKDVIGQQQAKKTLSVELFNHAIRREQLLSFDNNHVAYPKSNVLLVGPSGSGKTFLARKCAEIIDVPFIKIDAASSVKSGIVGNSIMDHFQSYYCTTEDKEKLEYSIVLIDEFDKLATHYAPDRNAIQNELLNLIGENGEASFEPSRNQPKVKLDCSNMLFILCGAFHDLTSSETHTSNIGFHINPKSNSPSLLDRTMIQEFGFSAEIMNRIHKIAHLEQLSELEIFKLLKTSKSSPVIPYKNLFSKLGQELIFTDDFFQGLARLVSSSEQNGRAAAIKLAEIMEDIIYNRSDFKTQIILNKKNIK